MQLHEIGVTLKSDYSSQLLCASQSNIFTYFELLSDGSRKKSYSPLKYILLKGSKNETLVFQLDSRKQTLLNMSDIAFWVQVKNL